MRTLHISVLDKKAAYLSRDGEIVCGNSDYVIEFAFDAEWDAYGEKIARFIWNGQYKDVTFTGTSCSAPIITNATEVEVGVYAGELSTTTPAVIGCQKSILCKSAPPSGIPFTKGEKGDPGATADIMVVDSVENLPEDAEDGTIALVPSDGENGDTPIIELETHATLEVATLTDDEIAQIQALNGGYCLLKVNIEEEDGVVNTVLASPVIADLEDGYMYCFQAGAWQVIITVPNAETTGGSV